MQYKFTINQRLFSEFFSKYSNTFSAFCELINNALQAKATEVQINFTPSKFKDLSGVAFESITIRDNGIGVPKSEFEWKILQVATDSKEGGKGVGRFAGFQIGSVMEIETVAYDDFEKASVKTTLTLDSTKWHDNKTLENIKIEAEHTKLPKGTDSYYQVTIHNLYSDEDTKNNRHKRLAAQFASENIKAALFAAYADTIFQQKTKIIVDGKWIDPKSFIMGDVETVKSQFTALDGTTWDTSCQFMLVDTTQGEHHVFLRLNNAGLKSVAHSFDYHVDIPEQRRWFAFVDSPYLDENTDSLRNLSLGGLDPIAEHFRTNIQQTIDTFLATKYEGYYKFINQLRVDKFYPYREKAASSTSRNSVFNQIAYHVEVEHHLLTKNNDLRKLVYTLLDRSLNQGDFEELLTQIINLNDETIKNLKALLAKVEVENVVSFCEHVARKSEILDLLHNLIYGENIAKLVKERSQLHKFIEKHLWLFGEQYNNTPILFSDQNLAKNLETLRNDFFEYEPNAQDENLIELKDDASKSITDLFFFNEKILDDARREVMVVELKAPRVKINKKELNQAEAYAYQIQERGVFPDTLVYRIFLVGSDISGFVKSKHGSIDKNNPYVVYRPEGSKPVEVWVIKWSELIDANRRKLSYLGNLLKLKDKAIKDMLEDNFDGIPLHKLKSVMGDSPPDSTPLRKRVKIPSKTK